VFAYDPRTTREEALRLWFTPGAAVYVAEHAGRIVGSYWLKPNQPGRGFSVGRNMGEHPIAEARRLGYRALQFNLVVATNTAAVKLWTSLGFQIIGTLPGVFHRAQLGYVDAHVMYLSLEEQD
jgi:L-amino acid N-acyltransferase YncA